MKPLIHLLAGSIASLLIGLGQLHAQTPQLQEHWWQTPLPSDIPAAVVDTSMNTLFVGAGTDMTLAPPVPTNNGVDYGVVVEADGVGWPYLEHDPPNAIVRAVLPDGTGGWFIGGDFTSVGSTPRQKLARLNANGTLNTAWGPDAGVQGEINTMAIHNGVLYVGGSFSSAGGAPVVNNLAAFDINSGDLLPWGLGSSMGTNGEVWALTVGDDVVYAGGWFTMAGGVSHMRIAAFDANTGTVMDWSPTIDGSEVNALCHVDGVLYVGGSFSSVNGENRSRIAAINASDGSPTPWNPSAGGIVKSIAVSGDTVFVGGYFSSIGGSPRSRFAALDRSINANNALPSGYANFNGAVHHIAVVGGLVYVAGGFSQVVSPAGNSEYRFGTAALERSSGEATTWNPGGGATIYGAFAVSGGSAYIAGNIGHKRSGVFAMDMTTGRPTAWRSRCRPNGNLPNTQSINGVVKAMALKGDTVFIAGTFTQVDGATRNRVAALHKITGALLDWQVDANGTVSTIAVVGNMLYMGGDFGQVNGVARSRLARVNIATMSVSGWQADVGGSSTNVIHAKGDKLYVGGSFFSVGGEPRTNLAILDRATGAVLPFSMAISSAYLSTIAISGDTIFIGGAFNTVNTLPRNHLAAIRESSMTVLPDWICDASGSIDYPYVSVVHDLLSHNDVLYVANPQLLNGQSVDGLGIVDARTGSVHDEWHPVFSGVHFSENTMVQKVVRTGGLLFVLGRYRTVNNAQRAGISVWSGMNEFEDIVTGINPRAAEPALVRFAPNPFTGTLTVFPTRHMQPRDLSVLDATGRLVCSQPIANTSGPVTVDLSGHENGLYLLQVRFADGTRAVERVVKE